MKRKKTYDGSRRYYDTMYQVFKARVGDKALAAQIASEVAANRRAGYQKYAHAWVVTRGILLEHKVPTILWGLYRSFVFEAIKLCEKGFSFNVIVERWIRKANLQKDIMEEIGRDLGIMKEKNTDKT